MMENYKGMRLLYRQGFTGHAKYYDHIEQRKAPKNVPCSKIPSHDAFVVAKIECALSATLKMLEPYTGSRALLSYWR